MTATRKPRAKELGVTPDEYERLLAAQGGGCAICGNPPKTRRLDVDHDHRTKAVRGLLCHRCNRALPAWIRPEWLLQAYGYLSGYGNRPIVAHPPPEPKGMKWGTQASSTSAWSEALGDESR